MPYMPVYKCALCGMVIHRGDKMNINPNKLADSFSLALSMGFTMGENKESYNVTKSFIHKCGGNVGVANLVGFAKVEADKPIIKKCFTDMGFDHIPTMDELRKRHRELAKQRHPDAGGSTKQFHELQDAYLACVKELEANNG